MHNPNNFIDTQSASKIIIASLEEWFFLNETLSQSLDTYYRFVTERERKMICDLGNLIIIAKNTSLRCYSTATDELWSRHFFIVSQTKITNFNSKFRLWCYQIFEFVFRAAQHSAVKSWLPQDNFSTNLYSNSLSRYPRSAISSAMIVPPSFESLFIQLRIAAKLTQYSAKT